jgi:hypothetical protein
VPGLYNERGRITVSEAEPVQAFDIFNLTAAGRVRSLDTHFEVVQAIMKEQMRVE